MSIFNYSQNNQSKDNKSRLNDQLDHNYGRGRWIHVIELEQLAVKKYETNGKGITYADLVREFRCPKDKAQRRLKNACIEKRDKIGKKFSILFTLDNVRTKPQQYFPTCKKAKIIEDRRKNQNRIIATTGVSYNNKAYSSSYYPLYNAIENQIVNSFLTQLSLLPFQPLNMHNIRLWLSIDKTHFEEIEIKPLSHKNKTKIQTEWIGVRKVVFQFHKRGSVEIEIACSRNPFPIETDNDVYNFFVFLGQVKERLVNILHDPRERIVPLVDSWILKYCDFNKDVEIRDSDIGQLMNLNIQIKSVGESFRLYVKNLEDRFVLRGEKVMKVDQPVTAFLNSAILNLFHLYESKFNELTIMVKNGQSEVINRINKLEENQHFCK